MAALAARMQTLLAMSLLLAACGTSEPDAGDDDGCGTEQLSMSGAYDVSTPSAATVTVSDRIIGVGGFTANASGSYLFSMQDTSSDDFAQVGTFDVAERPMKYLEGPADANCDDPGQCRGFFATAGTVDVLALEPFQATFSLSGLYEANDLSDTHGAPINGLVTGCVTSSALQ